MRSSTHPGEGDQDWLVNMAHAIQTKLGAQCPNIVLYDWREDADVLLNESEREELSAFIDQSIAALPRWIRTVIPESTIRAVLFGTDIIFDALGSRAVGGPQSGRRLSDWILSQTGGNQPHIDPLKPIHFIGHSAGGFCMGEAATRLKDRNVVVDRVTILILQCRFINTSSHRDIRAI